MSETVNFTPEQGNFEKLEVKHTPETHEEVASSEHHEANAETARAAVHEATRSAQHLALPVDDNADDNQPLVIDKTVRAMNYKRSMKQVRRQLSAPERTLSRVVHQPVVKAVSEASSKTITRSSGLLGGGVFAFIGSVAYLYLAHHIGFRYNYLLFTLFFIGGFIVGLILELALDLVRPHHAE